MQPRAPEQSNLRPGRVKGNGHCALKAGVAFLTGWGGSASPAQGFWPPPFCSQPQLASSLKGLIKANGKIKSLLSGPTTPVLALACLAKLFSSVLSEATMWCVGTCSSADFHDELCFFVLWQGARAGHTPAHRQPGGSLPLM